MSLLQRLHPTTGLAPTAGAHDPYWDMDGSTVRRSRLRQNLVAGLALALSIVACGLSSAAWIREFNILGLFGS